MCKVSIYDSLLSAPILMVSHLKVLLRNLKFNYTSKSIRITPEKYESSSTVHIVRDVDNCATSLGMMVSQHFNFSIPLNYNLLSPHIGNKL